ncbi:23S ribosomal RNA methyltransferase Erm [Dietzia psychralcaliphila]|uniref:23S ribosomal RNA methyltransferase Erm n=1 Tax=Dietzia psychralcaliphila TaxID=139021 RepID=A0AAD0NPC1_9ACTN|nr:23S ribosomal RNA methyltransferase Erm [Dietzia psychralcaliphila]AWH96926.1 23S ribosomal RNA methyltransferase Erm [Dietzia psychralcaliphila]PTM89593.1 23S rRNA (adenine-N6)-dimethyltransferase [Dietzia psychralcaliphila]
MPTYRGGRHEHGQNFLTDTTVIDEIIDIVDETSGPIIEIGPGRGALTTPLQSLDRPLTAVEIDSRTVEHLQGSLATDVELVHADFVQWPLPTTPHVVVGNLPFHLTTSILRKLLHSPSTTTAVLLVQWEVARRRAGVGGATMMTAQWWPWIEFTLHRRVPRRAFRPEPTVDGALLVLYRRPRPLLADQDRSAYRRFVHDVFTGRGRGIAAILATVVHPRRRSAVRGVIARAGVAPDALPRDLTAQDWVALYAALGRQK